MIAVLGTGMVGRAIASRLAALGHDVAMGARSAENESANAWATETGNTAWHGTFAEVTEGTEVVFNCTGGLVALDALNSVGRDALAGKVLIDVSNPLDHRAGGLPSVVVSTNGSVGEQIQRAFPATKVVKALNTMNNALMVEPRSLGSPHNVFICGNDAAAKEAVRALLAEFGWPEDWVLDLGGIEAARGLEMYLELWLHLSRAVGGAFNIRVVDGSVPGARRP